MKDYDLVSVIMPSYNSSRFIAESIESILSQTYKNWELLITDDKSDDNTVEIINEYISKDSRIKLFLSDENSGAGVARNNSIEKAEGRFIAFCDSDDMWTSEKLEKQIDFMISNNYLLTYTSYLVCNDEDIITGVVKCLKRLSYRNLLQDDGIGCLTAIYDTSKFGKMYMPDIRRRQDWALWLKIIKYTNYAYGLNDKLAIYRKGGKSLSSNKIKLLKENFIVYYKIEDFSFFTSTFLLFGYFMPYYIYKKIKQKVHFIISK